MTSMRRSEFLVVASATACAAFTRGAAAQSFPSRPIEIVVPVAPGGGTDIVARAFAEVARKYLPQPMVVLNRPGASGAIGMQEVLNARPDGYKVGLVYSDLAILPGLKRVRFSSDDFNMIALLNADPGSVVVPVDSPWRSIEDMVAEAKRRPGTVKLGNSGPGSIWHMAAAAMEDKVGAEFLHVPFTGSAPGLAALMGNHLEAVATSPGEASAYVQGGKMRILAVMAEERASDFPEVPTLKERGFDVSVSVWRGLAVHHSTPAPVVATLTEVARRTAEDPAFRDALARASLTFTYADGDAFRALANHDREVFRQLIERLHIE
ncbi:Bug family tripartite tricarboxylate transporter substrate binding protein [Pseudoroseomonas wenyumeiae]